MNNKIKVILLALAILAMLLFVVSCDEENPYASYDDDGYTVSVKYDANGGSFTAGTGVIVDTYKLENLPLKNGKRLAKLIEPDDDSRGDGNYFPPKKTGYVFVGWYADRTGSNNEYTYSARWDFDKDRLELDEGKEYTAQEPALTLYAAWIPEFTFEFYSLSTKELLGDYKVSPYAEITLPEWNTKTGKLNMHQFPVIEGKTYAGAYLDEDGTVAITEATIKHKGSVNYESATAQEPITKIYIDTVDGEWQRIYSVEQLQSVSLSGKYMIMNDLDFTGNYWSDVLIKGTFRGELVGYGEEPIKLKGIEFSELYGANITSVGLFGQLAEGARLQNISFVDVKMSIKNGAPLTSGVNFGLLAGTVNSKAILEDVTVTGNIDVSYNCSFKGNTYYIGLLCASGSVDTIDISGITCTANNEGAKPEREIELSVEDGMVTIIRKSK
ncbi:MAG: hypothetical protein J6B29_05595 [Clostridia bacterium]|nr:hypothetical protein [Clostridia bacterium]